jgi:hypothetical protein
VALPDPDWLLRGDCLPAQVRGAHQVLASSRLKGVKLDPLDVVARVEAQQAAEAQQRQQAAAA